SMPVLRALFKSERSSQNCSHILKQSMMHYHSAALKCSFLASRDTYFYKLSLISTGTGNIIIIFNS
ncbi:hypothetical protein B0F90DRAFT_1750185, partial [Multifurca ochricompacta]